MGLGSQGGYFDGNVDFKWDRRRHQDNFWVGAVNGGLRLKFMGDNYVKPLVNIYYSQKPINIPESWGGTPDSGIRYDKDASAFTI